jgi:hypothetical protein
MNRRALVLVLLSLGSVQLAAQNLEDLQIHGFATQGFLYSSHNNYLTMSSSRGSLQWTEGAISLSDSLSDNLRVGMQMHMYEMGQIGGPNVVIDWASGDYTFSDQFGVRAGKVKLPLGLYNDSQDVDSLFLWVLLPQSTYPVENRDFELALLGGEVYGEQSLRAHGGRAQYRAYYGESVLDPSGGFNLELQEDGLFFTSPPSGRNFGGDLRWLAPWRGLLVGASGRSQALDGTAPQGSLHMAPEFINAFYAEWKWKKASFEGEYWRYPLCPVLTIGSNIVPAPTDSRAWYAMASYDLTKRFQVGTYYSHYVDRTGNTSLPENHSKDWVIAERYNFNQYFYGKLEGHFLHGTGLGYYANTNPNGLKPNSSMLAARVGFAF